MKGLSLKQPYAELPAIGKKTIESRKWCIISGGIFIFILQKI